MPLKKRMSALALAFSPMGVSGDDPFVAHRLVGDYGGVASRDRQQQVAVAQAGEGGIVPAVAATGADGERAPPARRASEPTWVVEPLAATAMITRHDHQDHHGKRQDEPDPSLAVDRGATTACA